MLTDKAPTFGLEVQDNPFEITKAVDFTDSEINDTWVDWPAPGGFSTFLNVKSQMPRIVLGGKGTGRTHILRHFSAPVQTIRGNENPIRQVLEDGVLGIYVRCSGLDSHRFRGRRVDDDTWQTVFAQYADLWLAQAALGAFRTVTVHEPPSKEIEHRMATEILEILYRVRGDSVASLKDLDEVLYLVQRDIDIAVNNAALNPAAALDLTIQSSPGKLVFGVPATLRRHYRPLRDITCLYLIDEFENFQEPQQQYVNSLIREKEIGTSFMIGVRSHGLRTLSTRGGGEENKRGSEYDEIRPDWNYTTTNDIYEKFCKEVVDRRLNAYGLLGDDLDNASTPLSQSFEIPPDDYEERQIIERYSPTDRPYFRQLRRNLTGLARSVPGGPLTAGDVDLILDAVRVPSRPLLEKVNIFIIYRAWSDGEDLVSCAKEMICNRANENGEGEIVPNTVQRGILAHYINDMKAQLCRDRRGDQTYAGIDEFIAMSEGLPRNLLVILKSIFRWSVFNGEEPFRKGVISLDSQRRGLLDASNWFFMDAKPLGEDGEDVHFAIHRLGELLRRLRFSDKPVECSMASFSADLTKCSEQARKVVELAEKWSLLISVEKGQKQRNTRVTESKYHLNRLLCPRWELPTARRGAIGLNTDELNGIFAPESDDHFLRILNKRLERMTVPFGGSHTQGSLQQAFDLEG